MACQIPEHVANVLERMGVHVEIKCCKYCKCKGAYRGMNTARHPHTCTWYVDYIVLFLMFLTFM